MESKKGALEALGLGDVDPTLALVGLTALLGVLVVLILLGSGVLGGSKAPVALSATEYRDFTLVRKAIVSHDTRRFRFALQSDKHVLGLPIGQHISLMYEEDDADRTMCMRPYTPTTSDDEKGYVDFVIKVYPNGKMGNHLDKLAVGSGTIKMKGPKGSLEYKGHGRFNIKVKREVEKRQYKRVAMVAGGTGITPMTQIIQAIVKLRAKGDKTELSLIFANKTEEDILVREWLEELRARDPLLKLHYTLDSPPRGWTGSTGFVTAEMMKAHLPAPHQDVLLLTCGPKPMVKHAVEANAAELGYDMTKSFFSF